MVSIVVNREKQTVLISREAVSELLTPAVEEPAVRKPEPEKTAEVESQGRRRGRRRPD